jgi:hypothetical protein
MNMKHGYCIPQWGLAIYKQNLLHNIDKHTKQKFKSAYFSTYLRP